MKGATVKGCKGMMVKGYKGERWWCLHNAYNPSFHRWWEHLMSVRRVQRAQKLGTKGMKHVKAGCKGRKG